jgi:IMP cyclohydrolase
MVEGLEALSRMDYPGRFIVLGKTPKGDPFAVYGVTGRSASSQARKMQVLKDGDGIEVVPTDESLVAQGRRDLLVYPSVIWSEGSNGGVITVSNGAQTREVSLFAEGNTPTTALFNGHQGFEYEPDEPNFTPRISGVLRKVSSAMGIIRRAESGDGCLKNYFEFKPVSGEGRLISTYSGVNENPVPSFVGEPLRLGIHAESAEGIARTFYDDALNPDFRVSVVAAVVSGNDRGDVRYSIVNRHDEENKGRNG